ncbi:MAG: hypothetical protein J0H85_11590 [Sediminibacterium magnilacihabitans]|jgi:hypothetical protein|nr:hypothetical protein [Sediminibacterium magnilacihabitans]PQV59878.1 hypothetical protein CLV53_1122 [Sediminibacterium magnilacihabitans]
MKVRFAPLFAIGFILLTYNGISQTNTFPASGNVGIGTTSPSVKLDVVGGVSIQSNNNLTWGGSYGAGIPTISSAVGVGLYFYPTGSTSGSTFSLQNGGATFYTDLSVPGKNFYFGTNGNPSKNQLTAGFMRLTAPNDLNTLDISSTSTGTVFSTNYYGGGSAQPITMQTYGNSNQFYLSANSNVGIGTSNPAVKLDVVGGINIQSNNNLTWGGSYGAGTPTISAAIGAGLYFYPTGSTSGSTFSLQNNGASFYTDVSAPGKNVFFGTNVNPSRNQLSAGFFRLTAPNDLNTLDVSAANTGVVIATNYYGGGSVQPITMQTYGNANQFYLSANSNVGIGTSSPSEKLSVNGNIKTQKLIVTQTGWSDYVFDSSYQLKSLPDIERFIRKNKHLPDIPSTKEVEEKGVSVGDNQALLLKKIEELTLYIIDQQKQINEH